MEPNAKETQAEVIDIAIRLGALGLLVAACFWILAPFLMAIAWGAIIAVAVHPIYGALVNFSGGRAKLSATLVTLLLLLLLLAPGLLLAGSLLGGAQTLAGDAQSGALRIPPPPKGIAHWPVIGAEVETIWMQASTNVEGLLQRFSPQIREGARWLLATAAGTGFTFVQFILAIAISGVLLANDSSGTQAARQFTTRLAGENGPAYAEIAATTIRSVTRGILGVALIQSILAGLGFIVVGIPAAGLLILLCLIVTVVQLPIALVTIPAVVYVVSTADTVTSVLFVAWNILVAPADNVLKPLLLGRDAPVPTLILFLGAIGGFMAAGLIGLFVGAVVLSLGFVLYESWVGRVSPPIDTAERHPTPEPKI